MFSTGFCKLKMNEWIAKSSYAASMFDEEHIMFYLKLFEALRSCNLALNRDVLRYVAIKRNKSLRTRLNKMYSFHRSILNFHQINSTPFATSDEPEKAMQPSLVEVHIHAILFTPFLVVVVCLEAFIF